MDWVQFAIQWLHVLMGITWFGLSLTTNLVFVPSITRLPLVDQQRLGGAYGQTAARVARVAAGAVIVLGILRGTFWGPIRSLDRLVGTAYGWTWLLALVAAILTAAWGERVITRLVERLNTIAPAEAVPADGAPTPALAALISTAKRNALLELLGLFVIFTCMILMRFGL